MTGPGTVSTDTPAEQQDKTVYCSFCRNSGRHVGVLIAGPTVMICSECVTLCIPIVTFHPVMCSGDLSKGVAHLGTMLFGPNGSCVPDLESVTVNARDVMRRCRPMEGQVPVTEVLARVFSEVSRSMAAEELTDEARAELVEVELQIETARSKSKRSLTTALAPLLTRQTELLAIRAR